MEILMFPAAYILNYIVGYYTLLCRQIKYYARKIMTENTNKEKIIEFGYYRESSDIGNHERYLTKIGDFNCVIKPLRVTFLSRKGVATICYENNEYFLEEGTIVGANAIIKTNGVDVEIRNSGDEVIRLVGMSDFCLESTVEGFMPVVYGNVYCSCDEKKGQAAHVKYRTSCWTKHETPIMVERIDNTRDVYYAGYKSLLIYEYDESGRRFDIVNIEPYHKCTLSYNLNQPMISRYNVESVAVLKKNEIADLYEKYVSVDNWKMNTENDNAKIG